MVLATHSEVVLDATEPEPVFGFFGKAPRALAGREERSQLREAPERITTTDLLRPDLATAVCKDPIARSPQRSGR